MGRPASRYEVLFKLASGGMATVYVGRKRGPLGFSRVVAIKRAHPHLLEDEAFVRMLVDEARLASQLHHPNVVAVLDVEREGGDSPDLSLVMEYVEGASMSELLGAVEARGERLPPGVAVRLVLDACEGLQVAHELSDEQGQPLGLVHRDVSPHNILVGVDGRARVADFGIAKVTRRGSDSTTGSLKGKLSYMAPEYVESGELDARADVFALGIVLWEALAGRKLFGGQSEVEVLQRVAKAEVPPLSSILPELGADFDALLGSVLARSRDERFTTARAFGTALGTLAERGGVLASHAEVAALVRELFGARLEERRALVRARAKELDAASTGGAPGGGELRRAVDEASVAIAGAARGPSDTPSDERARVVDALSTDGTLGGSGVSSVRSRATRRSRLVAARWFVGAALAGSLVAIAWLGTRAPELPAASGSASSSASASADARPTSLDAAASTASADAPTVAPEPPSIESASATPQGGSGTAGAGLRAPAITASAARPPSAASAAQTGRTPPTATTAAPPTVPASPPSATPTAAPPPLDTIAPNPYAR